MVATYVETKFTQPVAEVFASEYKITAAIAEKMCMGDVINNDQNMTLGGVSYPSVAHPSKSENLAIRTQVVDTHLSLDYVEEVVVESVQEKVIQYKRTDFCSQFVDGNLAWSGTPIRWSVPPGATYSACAEPDGWVIRNEQGQIVNPG